MRYRYLAALLVVPLGACNTTGMNLGAAVGSVLGSTAGSTLSTSTISKVQQYTKAACAVAADVSSISAVADAIASSGTAVAVTSIGKLLCSAFSVGTAYAADTADQPQRAKPKKGDVVEGTVVVNGKPVPVAGTKTK